MFMGIVHAILRMHRDKYRGTSLGEATGDSATEGLLSVLDDSIVCYDDQSEHFRPDWHTLYMHMNRGP